MLVTAAEIARAHGLDPKRYRQALRDAKLSWYVWGAPWTVPAGSSQHDDMLHVLQAVLAGSSRTSTNPSERKPRSASRRDSDEAYIIDLCDAVLDRIAVRQHKLDFLRGDAGPRAQGRMLPVDAWYADLGLVIEYRERQHSEAVGFFDRRETVSGVNRGEQRRLYDQRRRELLPLRGIELVEFDYFEFEHTSNRRLARREGDRLIFAEKLRRFAA
jgi:hypothetical protein